MFPECVRELSNHCARSVHITVEMSSSAAPSTLLPFTFYTISITRESHTDAKIFATLFFNLRNVYDKKIKNLYSFFILIGWLIDEWVYAMFIFWFQRRPPIPIVCDQYERDSLEQWRSGVAITRHLSLLL